MKIKDFNQMVSYLTRPDTKTPAQNAAIKAKKDAEDTKRIASKRKEYGLPDHTKHIVDTLNDYEDTNIVLEEVIRNSPVPVKGYVGGATPDSTVPTKAERIAAQKQFEKIAVQPDSRGYFKKLAAADEKEFKDKRNLIGENLKKETLKPFIKSKKIAHTSNPMAIDLNLEFLLEDQSKQEAPSTAEIKYKKIRAEYDKRNSELVGLETLIGRKAWALKI